ncbi:hypothetical protein ThvES_00015560 [Thiovulum sp. ES]|nr:hypothetical protein ThvES_00015560 [Thiovulum sp. ES]
MRKDFLKFALVSSLIATSISGCNNGNDNSVIDSVLGTESSSGNGNGNGNGNGSGNGNGNSSTTEEEVIGVSIDENGTFHMTGEEMIAEIEISELSLEEEESLIYIREEEKLARDVYMALDEIWGDQVQQFSNIIKAEQSHTDSVKALLERYELEDPMTEEEDLNLGVFQNSELQAHYDHLVEVGSQSLIDALIVGATIEDLDIYDIELEIAKVDNEDIILIYENLVKGSENHMRAFINALSNEGGEYSVQYITEERFEEILSEETVHGDEEATVSEEIVTAEENSIIETESEETVVETSNSGNGNGNGNGSGNGNGNGNGSGNGNQ